MTETTVDLFAGETPPGTPPPVPQGDLFADMVGEGKKFKTPQDLAKAAQEKDAFIEQLKGENAEMRREVQTKAKSDAIDVALQKLNDKLEKASASPTATTAGLTRDDIRAMLQEEKQQERASTNLALVQAELLKKNNNDPEAVKAFLAKRATDLGLTSQDLKNMVLHTPQVAKTVLGLQQSTPSSGPTPNVGATKNSEAIVSLAPEGVRNKTYYNTLRKQMGTKFWSPAIQQQMFKDRKEQGEVFNQS
jgi:hypothetical protein